jgi:two-component system CheB/CheR fusion protein
VRVLVRVLVIDDDVDNAASLEFALRLGGHDVAVAHNGTTALALARRFRPDVVISDVGLPGMDGYAVARAFRADETLRDIYLVAVSGYTRQEDLDRAAVAGFDRYFVKPVTLEDLTGAIRDGCPPVRATAGAPFTSPAVR